MFSNIAFCSFFFILFFSLALNTKCPGTYHCIVNVFSIAVHIFRNLFRKICPLFGQILVRCLKCSKTSFSPSLIAKRCVAVELSVFYLQNCQQFWLRLYYTLYTKRKHKCVGSNNTKWMTLYIVCTGKKCIIHCSCNNREMARTY